MINEEIVTILEKRERKRLFSHLQASAESERHIPPMPFLILRKTSRILQHTGGVLIGIILGIFTLIFNFVLLIRLLHLEF